VVSGDHHNDAEADGVGAGVEGVAAAGGAAAVGGEHAPAAAADHLQRAALGPLRVLRRAFEVVVLPAPVLPPPLPVAAHVVGAPRVARAMRPRGGALARLLPAAAGEHRFLAAQLLPAGERGGGGGPAGVLPLRLRRQPVTAVVNLFV